MMKNIQNLARGRNYEKWRISGLAINTKHLSSEEKEIVRQIGELRTQLLNNWDENSKKLGLKVVRYKLTINGHSKYDLTKTTS